VQRVPGMYFVGLHFLYSMTSATVTGVGRDAARIANAINAHKAARKGESASRVLSAEAA
jgi:putative flavoprotein involved in K+ transport